MDLPVLLAGPILRRVESTLATVWIALSAEATVRLVVWEGSVMTGAAPEHAFVTSSPAGERTWRIGDQLHLGLLTARIPEASGKSFLPDQLYSYDLEIKIGGVTHTLKSLHMLGADTVDGVAHVPLGYLPDRLPTFAPPPVALTDLRVLYGSCRDPRYPGPDAMVWIDDMLAKDDVYLQPSHRPHQLFLGGDQIYADDVAVLPMGQTIDLGRQLIGMNGDQPIERIAVDHVQKRTAVPTQDHPGAGYTDEDAAITKLDPTLPIGRECFPEGRRLDVTRNGAQFTSEDGTSHLISLGEFAAAYLSAWSNACWPKELPRVTWSPDGTQPATTLKWTDHVEKGAVVTLPDLVFPERVPKDVYADLGAKALDERKQKQLRASHTVHRELFEGLPKVQRALANIATYMILDDHDVTDDYFLNPEWRDRVLTSALGNTIVTNAMIAYALFQDWGNDPLRYDSGFPAELLSRALDLFPAGAATGPAKPAFDRIQELLAHGTPNPIRADGQYDSVTPPILWHFTVDGPAHRVIALDNRTRRSYPGRIGPPGNVSTAAQLDQVPIPPKPPLLPGFQVLIVIAPLQVIGPPVLDEIVAPLSYRMFDLKNSLSRSSETDPSSRSGLREMTGTNPDAIEAWAFDAVVFENLLKRLVTYGHVVLLSGDVHNSSGSQTSYWAKDAAQPTRIAQFTSSGFKNVMPAYIAATDRTAGFAQQMIRAKLGVERIGWDQPEDDLVLLPTGQTQLDLVPIMRSRLQSVPVMIPTWGWPIDYGADPDTPPPVEQTSRLNPARPPDWRWRIAPLLDVRADADRPEPIRALVIDPDAIASDLSDPGTAIQGYQAIAARHQHALDRMRNARQILFQTNFGVCRFEAGQNPGTLDAIHEIYTAGVDPDNPVHTDAEAEAYLVQVAHLGPEAEDPPGPLRAKVIEAVPPLSPANPP